MKNRNDKKKAKQKKSDPIYNELRKNLIKHLSLAIPVFAVAIVTGFMENKFTTQPQLVLYILFPLSFLTFICWKILKGREEFILRGRFLILLLLVVFIFSIAASSGVLDGKRQAVGFEQSVPRNFLSLNWMGDWRYIIIPKKHRHPGLTIVTMKHTGNLGLARNDIIQLIGYAAANNARGIAFDFYLEKDSPLDTMLCDALNEAKNKNIPVLVAYRHVNFNGEIRKGETAKNLRKCIAPEQEGHAVCLTDRDGVVRMIPLYFRSESHRESLSLKVAKIMNADVKLPENGLLRFIKPKKDFNIYRYEDIEDNKEYAPLFRDQFILVGEESSKDKALTPFGEKLGVMIHAYGVHSLLKNHFIKPMPFWSHLLMIFVSCYWVTVRVKQGDSFGKLILLNAIISLIFLEIAIFALLFFLTWIEIIYSITALWLLLPLMLILRKRAGKPELKR